MTTEAGDPTAIVGQVDLVPGTTDPVAAAEGSARTARLARGTRALSDAEQRHRQQTLACSLPDKEEATTGCAAALHFAIFFDGTGNNRTAELDKPANQRALSNIARLFDAHELPGDRIESVYLAGVGTPCPEVGDDGGLLGLSIGKGGRERIDYALQQLDKLIDAQPDPMRIVVVNVSVFGFSRGAASARAFARDLATRCKEDGAGGWKYADRVTLRVAFMGIFDTVCSVWPTLAHAAVNSQGGHHGWADGMLVPPMVEQSVHMTASHELRAQFALDSTREHASYPDNTVEIWFPGVHSDVGGGYDPGHQGRSNSIARFALNEMYDMGRAGGALLIASSEFAPELLEEFNKSDPELQSVFNGYLAAVRVKQGTMETVQAAHMELLHRWMRVRIAQGENLPSMQRLAARRAALEAEVRTLRQRKAQLPDPWDHGAIPVKTAEWNEVADQLQARNDELGEVKKQQKGLNKETDSLLGSMVKLRRKRERGKRLTLAETTMLSAWDNVELLPPEVERFFDGYGHDSIAHWFIGDLTLWRVLYFGGTKYAPGKLMADEADAAPARTAAQAG